MRWVFLFFLTLLGCDPRVPIDAGIDAADAGALDGGPSDSGPPPVDASWCPEHIQLPYSGPIPCSTTTRDCARDCRTVDCAMGCFYSDPSSSCGDCFAFNQIACWNRNGCQEPWNCLSLCIQTNCPGADPACIGEFCPEQDQAYADCFEPYTQTCLERTLSCLPP